MTEIILTGLAAIGTIYLTWLQWIKEQAAERESKKINERLITLQSEVINTLTGGDSTPFLFVEATKTQLPKHSVKELYLLKFVLRNTGQHYPLRNVYLEIYDPIGFSLRDILRFELFGNGLYYTAKPKSKSVKKMFLKTSINKTIQTLNPHDSMELYVSPFKVLIDESGQSNNDNLYIVQIRTENVSFKYLLGIENGPKDIPFVKFIQLENNGNVIEWTKNFLFSVHEELIVFN